MNPRSLAPRFIASLCIVGALVLWQGEAMMQRLLPSIALTMDLIDRHHNVLSLDITKTGADTVIRLEAGIRQLILTGTHVTYADPRARAVITTPLATFWLAPSMTLALLMAWPASSTAATLMRLALAIPALAFVLLLDAPFVLDALLWGLHRDAHDPHGTSTILVWSAFLKAGGRFLLGAAAAAAVIAASHTLAEGWRSRTSR
ncbi:hypothetical protein [Methyloversatilis sp.]|uniref:hypothetical protein n=1 Tax=Methyloversatilis sp. TaxID=2569862 RepID=UPI0027375DE2|nr:hypothetical protein [Methyloversatilis sp.]MDP2868364.1 hypothetical protein [Methyloversatilis sp.]MDP3454197.1 hypothetical protein [Methyloversatilis sp.]MDP3578363.1 hypothetical protein [Methyloversatilis sp.]